MMKTLEGTPSVADAATDFGPSTDQDLIIKEARRRQRRRWIVVSTVIVVAAAVALAVTLPPESSPSKPMPSISRTKPSPPPAAVARSAPSDLSVSIGFVQGTAQHWFIPLTFTNVSHARCSVTGTPTLLFVNQAGQMVGVPIKQEGGGSNRPIPLNSGEGVGAALWEPNATDTINAGQPCSPMSWAAVRVTSPTAAVVTPSEGAVSAATTTCTTGEGAWVGPLRVPGP